MGLRHHLKKLLAEADEDNQTISEFTSSGFTQPDLYYTTEIPWPSIWSFAKFAYIAEQYGYRYAGLQPDMADAGRPTFIFRRTPDALIRAERTRAQYPRALEGGQLPGMRAWRFPLLPQPRSRPDVRLLHARIKVDYFSTLGRQQMRPWFIRIAAVCLVVIIVNGQFNASGLRLAAGVAVGLGVLVATSRIFMRRRIIAYRKKLEQAGINWPPPTDQVSG